MTMNTGGGVKYRLVYVSQCLYNLAFFDMIHVVVLSSITISNLYLLSM